jgi:hypothetical protein
MAIRHNQPEADQHPDPFRRSNLPARLDAAAAKLLGFKESDMQILLAMGKLTPLGDPAPNAPKWFATVEIIQLAIDQDWLHISDHSTSHPSYKGLQGWCS